MIKCSVKSTGTQEFLTRLESMKQLDLTDLGEVVRKRMIGIIDENRKRIVKVASERYQGKYKAHLKNSIYVQPVTNGIEIAIDATKTPYWEVVNNGGYIPGPVRGGFSDEVGGQTGSFAYNPDMPKMTPKKPIRAMNYIQKTETWVAQNLQKYLEKAVANAWIGDRFTNRLKTSKILKNFQE